MHSRWKTCYRLRDDGAYSSSGFQQAVTSKESEYACAGGGIICETPTRNFKCVEKNC